MNEAHTIESHGANQGQWHELRTPKKQVGSGGTHFSNYVADNGVISELAERVLYNLLLDLEITPLRVEEWVACLRTVQARDGVTRELISWGLGYKPAPRAQVESQPEYHPQPAPPPCTQNTNIAGDAKAQLAVK